MIFKAGVLRKAGADIPADIGDEDEISAHRLAPYKPRFRKRDLENAITLRPREVYELYGIHPTSVSIWARHPDPALRLPSLKIPGRNGRRGARLINHDELKAWLARWREPSAR